MRLAAIQPPRLRTAEEGGDRSATWLELFYDLVFVVAVAVLGIRLIADTSWTGLASYLGYFVALWWLWASFTFYADRYDTDDLVYRLLAVGQIVAIALLAASISSGPAGSTTAFALAYAAARIVLILMYERVRRHVPETRVLVTGYIKGFTVGAAIWLISAFVPEPFRFFLWAIALAVELATPYIMRREQAKVPLDVSHLPERFGLFTILVLGESIAAVVAGLGGLGWELAPTLTAALGVVVATGMWWMYFDNLEGSVVRRRADQAKSLETHGLDLQSPAAGRRGGHHRVSGWSTPCSRRARTTPTPHHAGSSSGPSPWPSPPWPRSSSPRCRGAVGAATSCWPAPGSSPSPSCWHSVS